MSLNDKCEEGKHVYYEKKTIHDKNFLWTMNHFSIS